MIEKPSKRISVEVDLELHTQMKVKAAEEQVKIADLVRSLIVSWLNDSIKIVKVPTTN
jgi:exosome complex RNA-binding protein Csl4